MICPTTRQCVKFATTRKLITLNCDPVTSFNELQDSAPSEDFLRILEEEEAEFIAAFDKEFNPEILINSGTPMMLQEPTNVEDPVLLNRFLNLAIGEAMKVTESNLLAADAKLLRIKNEKMRNRYQSELKRPEYRRGLFVTALRRALTPLRSKLSAWSGAHRFLDSIVQASNWQDYGLPETRFNLFEKDITVSTSGPTWVITYSMIVEMCNGVWTPEPEKIMLTDNPLEQEIQNDLSELERLTKLATDTLRIFPNQIESIKKVGEQAEQRQKEIYS